jgi:hypothetical protein
LIHAGRHLTPGKLYLLIGLSIAFAATAYVRFFHKTAGGCVPPPTAPVRAAAAAPLTVDARPVPAVADATAVITEFDQPPRRDLFHEPEPPPPPVPAMTPLPESLPAKPAFTLRGTIVSPGNAMAIVDDRIVRTGDWLEGYEVVGIGKNTLWLRSGQRSIALEVLYHE